MTTYTIITGAGSGLGKEFALQCAQRGRNLILLGLPGSGIRELATALRREYRVAAVVYELNMLHLSDLRNAARKISQHYAIDFLINNAGTGGSASITDCAPELLDEIIQLNVRGTVLFTKLLLPKLLRNKESHILNVSSMAAFTPIAYKTVYPASKAFISSFSLGLREELKESGIRVSVLYPGPIMTNSNTAHRILRQGRKVKMSLLSTSRIVQIALDGALEGQPEIIPGTFNRLSQILMSFLPAELTSSWVSRAVKKEVYFSDLKASL